MVRSSGMPAAVERSRSLFILDRLWKTLTSAINICTGTNAVVRAMVDLCTCAHPSESVTSLSPKTAVRCGGRSANGASMTHSHSEWVATGAGPLDVPGGLVRDVVPLEKQCSAEGGVNRPRVPQPQPSPREGRPRPTTAWRRRPTALRSRPRSRGPPHAPDRARPPWPRRAPCRPGTAGPARSGSTRGPSRTPPR
jgi:hypothetical protein